MLSLATMVGVALGTPGSGVTPETLGAGSINHRIQIGQGAGDFTVVGKATLAPNGTRGWHSHPGKTLVIVASGTVMLYRAHEGECRVVTFEEGEAWVEKPTSVHQANNETDQPVVLIATYFRAQSDLAVRIDKPDPVSVDLMQLGRVGG